VPEKYPEDGNLIKEALKLFIKKEGKI